MMPDTVTVPLADLRAWAENYNVHPDDQIEELRQSLRQFGQFKNVVVWNGEVIAGNGLLAAMQGEGWQTCEVKDYSHLSRAEAEALAVADNELPRKGQADNQRLAAIIERVRAANVQIPSVDDERIKDIVLRAKAEQLRNQEPQDAEPQIDKAEELREKWGVQTGDVWELQSRDGQSVHRVVCGDCTYCGTVDLLMGGELLALICTDPPYNVDYSGKNEFLNKYDKGNSVQDDIQNDNLSLEEICELWRGAFEQLHRVARPGCVIYANAPQGGDQMMMMMMMMMMQSVFPVRHELIWLKNNHVLGRTDYAYKHEPILYAWKDGGHKFYGEFQTSVIEIDKPQQSKFHPTMKPVALIERLIQNSSLPGELVGDFFLGSGTTLIASENLGRVCRGIEIAPKYVAVALERYFQAFGIEAVRVTQ